MGGEEEGEREKSVRVNLILPLTHRFNMNMMNWSSFPIVFAYFPGQHCFFRVNMRGRIKRCDGAARVHSVY